MSTLDVRLPTAEFRYFRTRKLVGLQAAQWLEQCYAWLAITIYGGAMTFPLRMLRGAGTQLPGESDPVAATFNTVTLGVVVIALVLRHRRILPLLRFITPFTILVGLCFLSALWSDHPPATLRRSTTLAICLLYGTYCFDAFGAARLIGMMLKVLTALGVLSIVVYFAIPAIGHETAVGYTGAMRGVFSQKNGLAECMLIAISCSTYRLLEERRLIEFSLVTPVLFGCVSMSASATSLMTACVLLGITGYVYLRPWPRARALYLYASGSILLVLVSAFAFAPDEVLGGIGRDTSLTGRLPLWEAISHVIAQRPFFGHGYSGFWDASSPDVQDLWQRIGWQAPDTHNGYLDIMVQLGAMGILFYILVWGRILYLVFHARRERTLPLATWVMMFMLINILVNMDEGPLPWADDYTLVMPTILIILGIWNESVRQPPPRMRSRQRSLYPDLYQTEQPADTGVLPLDAQMDVDVDVAAVGSPRATGNGA